jgi:hypothetical protein
MQTASYLKFEKKTWKSLDELDAGVCDGMTYEEIEVSSTALFILLGSWWDSKNTQKITKVEMRINSITDIEVVNRIVMWLFVFLIIGHQVCLTHSQEAKLME